MRVSVKLQPICTSTHEGQKVLLPLSERTICMAQIIAFLTSSVKSKHWDFAGMKNRKERNMWERQRQGETIKKEMNYPHTLSSSSPSPFLSFSSSCRELLGLCWTKRMLPGQQDILSTETQGALFSLEALKGNIHLHVKNLWNSICSLQCSHISATSKCNYCFLHPLLVLGFSNGFFPAPATLSRRLKYISLFL